MLIIDDHSPDGTGADRRSDRRVRRARPRAPPSPARVVSAPRTWPGSPGRWSAATTWSSRWTPTDRTARRTFPVCSRRLSDNNDLVLGTRWMSGGTDRQLAIATPTALPRSGQPTTPVRCSVLPIRDITGGFRAYRSAGAARRRSAEHAPPEGFLLPDRARVACLRRQTSESAEVPITFVERAEGASKMSQAIVVEAMRLVTVWGFQRRIAKLFGRRRPASRAKA